MKHRPWFLSPDDTICNTQGQFVADPCPYERGHSLKQHAKICVPRAKFIVRACNSHDDLLAALETIVAARDNYHGGDLTRAVDAARPIIARAKLPT